MGCILGMGVIGPVIGAVRGRSLAAVKQYSAKVERDRIYKKSEQCQLGTFRQTGKLMAGGLVAISPAMTELAIKKSNSDYQVWDRAYRIRNNQGQMRADRFAFAGGAAGAAAGVAAAGAPLTGALAGFAAGCVSAGIYSNVILKKG